MGESVDHGVYDDNNKNGDKDFDKDNEIITMRMMKYITMITFVLRMMKPQTAAKKAMT